MRRAFGDNDQAVVDGIASTATVLTAAELIMISVFLAFVLGEDPFAKMLGLGLATAVLVDATIVRVILVPVTMSLSATATGGFRASSIASSPDRHGRDPCPSLRCTSRGDHRPESSGSRSGCGGRTGGSPLIP